MTYIFFVLFFFVSSFLQLRLGFLETHYMQKFVCLGLCISKVKGFQFTPKTRLQELFDAISSWSRR